MQSEDKIVQNMKELKRTDIRWVYLALLIGVVSCAKENLPVDRSELETYNKLYLVQSSLTGNGNINYQLYVNMANPDTSFSVCNIAIGGGIVADKDIPVSLEKLGQGYVDAYNKNKATAYKLLPEGSYQLVTDTLIKKGNSSTGMLPIKIDLPQLTKGAQYLLPVRFTANDPSHAVDEQRQIAYFIFRATVEPTGRVIGNIPLANDPRTRIVDFFDDILVRDTSGNLWRYPLGDGETLGEPVQIGSGFSNVNSLIFNRFYSKLIGIYNSGPFVNHIVSFTVTEPPNVEIGAPWLVYKSTDYSTPGFRESFWSGPNGYWYGIWTNNGLYWFNGLNANGVNPARTNINGGWDPGVYKVQLIIGKDIITNSSTGLKVYSMNETSSAVANDRWMVGSGFFGYLRLFSINFKDMIGIKQNGDVIRYKDFDVYGFYNAL